MEIRYHPNVLSEDLPRIGTAQKNRIKKSIENKLLVNPLIFGEPLRGILIPLWKLRVGDYRIVFGINEDILYIHAIGHRKEIYNKIASKRDTV